MKMISRLLVGTFLIMGLTHSAAYAKRAGILIVGTQAEVQKILSETKLVAPFSEQNPDAMVAVKLTRTKMTVYEGHVVDAIVHFIGDVVHGGVVIVLHVGSDLWNLLNSLVGTVIHVGSHALHAIVTILSNLGHLVVDGVTWVVMTASEILQWVAHLFLWILP